MTLIYGSPEPSDGPATHALVIGVGRYDYLDGRKWARPENDTGLGQLGSPPRSARAICDWLLKPPPGSPVGSVGLNNPHAPLGSVALLLSPADAYQMPDGRRVSVKAACFHNIVRAFEGWYRRYDASPENVALFYFCGHGVEKEGQALLAQDFWKYQLTPWITSVNFDATFRAMAACRARIQCYFVDACRSVIARALEDLDFSPSPLVTAAISNSVLRCWGLFGSGGNCRRVVRKHEDLIRGHAATLDQGFLQLRRVVGREIQVEPCVIVLLDRDDRGPGRARLGGPTE